MCRRNIVRIKLMKSSKKKFENRPSQMLALSKKNSLKSIQQQGLSLVNNFRQLMERVYDLYMIK